MLFPLGLHVGLFPWSLSLCSSNQSAWKLSSVSVNRRMFFFFLVKLTTVYIKKELQGKAFPGVSASF